MLMTIAVNENDQLVSIKQVERGLKCDCLCFECGEPVVAKNHFPGHSRHMGAWYGHPQPISIINYPYYCSCERGTAFWLEYAQRLVEPICSSWAAAAGAAYAIRFSLDVEWFGFLGHDII